jgi:hypothetical protein
MAGPALDWSTSATLTAAALGLSMIIYILIRILTHRHGEHGPSRNGKRTARKGENGKPPRSQS